MPARGSASSPAKLDALPNKNATVDLSGKSEQEIETTLRDILDVHMFTKLVLRKCELKQLPSRIEQMTNLTELHISENQLEDIPKNIMKLKSLKVC